MLFQTMLIWRTVHKIAYKKIVALLYDSIFIGVAG